jgi:hypothetical protein
VSGGLRLLGSCSSCESKHGIGKVVLVCANVRLLSESGEILLLDQVVIIWVVIFVINDGPGAYAKMRMHFTPSGSIVIN